MIEGVLLTSQWLAQALAKCRELPPHGGMASRKAPASEGTSGGTPVVKTVVRQARSRRPRWTGVYDSQTKAIEAARREGVKEIVIAVEKHDKQVSRFKLDTELLAEMLKHVSHEPQESDLQPSDRVVAALEEAAGPLPSFRTKEELFDALEQAG